MGVGHPRGANGPPPPLPGYALWYQSFLHTLFRNPNMVAPPKDYMDRMLEYVAQTPRFQVRELAPGAGGDDALTSAGGVHVPSTFLVLHPSPTNGRPAPALQRTQGRDYVLAASHPSEATLFNKFNCHQGGNWAGRCDDQ